MNNYFIYIFSSFIKKKEIPKAAFFGDILQITRNDDFPGGKIFKPVIQQVHHLCITFLFLTKVPQ